MHPLFKYAVLIIWVIATNSAAAQDVLYAQPGSTITIQSNANVYVQGNVVLSNNSSFAHQGRLYINRHTVTGVANWLDQTTNSYYYGAGTVIFHSTGTQTATSPNRFGTIEVRNSGLTLGSHIISDRWLLHSGVVNTATYRAIAVSTDERAVDATASNTNFAQSWFNGTLRRHLSPASVNSYLFPVGGALRVNSAQLFNLTTNPVNANYVDATFLPKPGTDAGLFLNADGLLYTSINEGGVWNLQPDVSTLTGQFDLRLLFTGFTGLSDNMFGILRRDIGSTNGADWIAPTGSSIPAINNPGRLYTDGYARRNALPIMGQFGIGSGNTVPLPITLFDFTAKRINDKQVKLKWHTNSDEQNSSFVIERRLSTETTFKPVGVVSSSNSFGIKEYSLIDPNADVKKSWYRLKIIEHSGNTTYSTIKIVDGIASAENSITIAPNPNKGQFTIYIKGTQNANQAFLFDEKGRLLKQFMLQADLPVTISGLPAGNYILSVPQLYENGNAFRQKIVVVR